MNFSQSLMAQAGFGSEYSQNEQQQLCTNSVWAIGEVALCCWLTPSKEIVRSALEPCLRPACDKIISMLSSQRLDKSLAQNLAAALGKLGLYRPQCVSQDAEGRQGSILSGVFKQWCLSLRMLKEEPERHYAHL